MSSQGSLAALQIHSLKAGMLINSNANFPELLVNLYRQFTLVLRSRDLLCMQLWLELLLFFADFAKAGVLKPSRTIKTGFRVTVPPVALEGGGTAQWQRTDCAYRRTQAQTLGISGLKNYLREQAGNSVASHYRVADPWNREPQAKWTSDMTGYKAASYVPKDGPANSAKLELTKHDQLFSTSHLICVSSIFYL